MAAGAPMSSTATPTSASGGPGFEGGEVVEGDGSARDIAGLSPGRLALRRLRKDRLTLVSLVVAGLFVLMALVAPLLTKLGVLTPFDNHQELTDINSGGLANSPNGGMNWSHPLGIEPGTGSDLLSRLILGLTMSLIIALSAAIMAVVIGTVLGLIAGYHGGRTDFWINRLIDMTLSFPQTLMLLALSGTVVEMLTNTFHVPAGPVANAVYVILILGIFGWPTIARLIRGLVLSQREREYVEAARSLGASNRRLYFTELLPNLWAPILVYGTLLLPAYVSAEAAFNYLGVGIKPPMPTLGNILADSTYYAQSAPTYFFFPAIVLMIVVLSFNLVGDGLRDALDPKSSR